MRGIGGRKDIWNRDCWFEMQEVAENATTPNEKEQIIFVRLSIENLELHKIKHLRFTDRFESTSDYYKSVKRCNHLS